jgi:dTDP-4-amino-4,6-dideoxygalactose transaminase
MSWDIALTDVVISEVDVEAVLDCYRSGWLTMGPRIQEFEQGFAEMVGARHALAVSSGSAAIHLALLGAGVGPGDEVIVPALTFVAAAGMVRACGGTPVLCDSISTDDHNLDPRSVADLITDRTRVVLATHWWGYPCDMAALRATCEPRGIAIVEDAAQAILADLDGAGQLAGTAGLAGCFSLFSKKQLCVGEGGVVVTDDDDLAAKVRLLRSHAMTSVTWDRHRGHAESYDIVDVGFNYRMDEPRAALALSRMPRLADAIDHRRTMVRAYRERLAAVDGIALPWSDEEVTRSAHFCFGPVFADRATRDRVRGALTEAHIQTTWYPAITSFTEYRHLGPLPRAEDIAHRHLVLPLSATLEPESVTLVCDAIERALSA